jgi:hypothetical protein
MKAFAVEIPLLAHDDQNVGARDMRIIKRPYDGGAKQAAEKIVGNVEP